MAFDPARLLQQLQNTGLAIKDQQLYQLIRSMILTLAALNSSIPGGAGTIIEPTTINNFISQFLISSLSDSDSGDGDSSIIPGPPGIDGANGMVPYEIPLNTSFVVPINKQALFSMNIDNNGTLEIDGFLIEVN